MRPFHIIIRALPRAELPTRLVSIDGQEAAALCVPVELQATPLGVSFEEAAEVFETLPRMHLEPDGSFVWVSSADEKQSWQVDGNLYDRNGSLVAIELKGTCIARRLVELFDIFRADRGGLMVELVRDAVFVRQQHFLETLTQNHGKQRAI